MPEQRKQYRNRLPDTIAISVIDIANLFSNAVLERWKLPEILIAWQMLAEKRADPTAWGENIHTKVYLHKSTAIGQMLRHFYLDESGYEMKCKHLTDQGQHFLESLELPAHVETIQVTPATHHLMMEAPGATDFWEILLTVMRSLPDGRSRIKRPILCRLSGLQKGAFKYARRRLAKAGFYRLCNTPHVSAIVHFRSVSAHGAHLVLGATYFAARKILHRIRSLIYPLNRRALSKVRSWLVTVSDPPRDPFEERHKRTFSVDWKRRRVNEATFTGMIWERRVYSFAQWLLIAGEDLREYEGLCS